MATLIIEKKVCSRYNVIRQDIIVFELDIVCSTPIHTVTIAIKG